MLEVLFKTHSLDAKKMSKIGEKKIYGSKLLTIYKELLKDPLKIWTRQGFQREIGISHKTSTKYLNILKKLKVVEEVPTISKWGKNYRMHKDVRGFRLHGKHYFNQST